MKNTGNLKMPLRERSKLAFTVPEVAVHATVTGNYNTLCELFTRHERLVNLRFEFATIADEYLKLKFVGFVATRKYLVDGIDKELDEVEELIVVTRERMRKYINNFEY